MGHRDACVGGRRERGRDAWDDLEGDAGLRQREGLLAASAEEEGVAAFETHDQGAGLRPIYQDVVDLVLAHSRVSTGLSDVYQLRVLGRSVEEPGVDETVVDDHVGMYE